MRKTTIRSLTAKGYSQKKIALILHIRKSKVVAAQRSLKIGKRAKPTGAAEFWKDVKSHKSLMKISHKQATIDVKYSPKWYSKRAKKDRQQWDMKDWKEQYEFERRLSEREKHMYKEWHVGDTPR